MWHMCTNAIVVFLSHLFFKDDLVDSTSSPVTNYSLVKTVLNYSLLTLHLLVATIVMLKLNTWSIHPHNRASSFDHQLLQFAIERIELGRHPRSCERTVESETSANRLPAHFGPQQKFVVRAKEALKGRIEEIQDGTSRIWREGRKQGHCGRNGGRNSYVLRSASRTYHTLCSPYNVIDWCRLQKNIGKKKRFRPFLHSKTADN